MVRDDVHDDSGTGDMSNDKDLVQLRWNHGQIEFRQRKTAFGGWHDQLPKLVVTREWTDWEKIPGVKGDESDAERWPG